MINLMLNLTMKNILISGFLLGMAHGLTVAPAEAHGKHRNHYNGPRVVVSTWGFDWFVPRPRKIRISEHCVYKPWNNRTVCKY